MLPAAVAALADLALRRPWALIAANLAVLAVATIVAAGTPGDLPVGSTGTDGAGEEADLVIATTGDVPVHSGVYRVALRVISSQVRSDAAVSGLSQGPISEDGRSTSLLVTLRSADDSDRQAAVERIEGSIDSGPLRLAYGGQVATWLDARGDLSGDLWKLELLATPFALLLLAGALGPRLALAPVICAGTAIAGALAGLRAGGAISDVSLLGIAPAAVVGLALGVEAPCLFLSRYRDEAAIAPPAEAVRRTLAAVGPAGLPLVAAITAGTAGLMVTTIDPAPSMILACALAALLALCSTLVTVPALLALTGPDVAAGSGVSGESRLARPARGLTGVLARRRPRTFVAAVLAVALMLAAGSAVLHGETRAFSSRDLPAGSQARSADAIAAGGSGGGVLKPNAAAGSQSPPARAEPGSLFAKLPLAAAVSAGALIVVLVAAFRSARVVPVAVATLLPAAAACGLCVLVFQDGHLADALGQERRGALETGAVASLLSALVAVCAFRAVVALGATREERSLGLVPERAAETAAAFTMPAAAVATAIAAAATAVLAGSDLYPAREFGLAVAAGLAVDLVLLRVPLVAALSRWGGG